LSFARTTERRFLFHGNAIAFAAHIRRPDNFFVPTIARSCLPVTGGRAVASEEKKTFADLISFESASSEATGDYRDLERAAGFTHGNHGENNVPTSTLVQTTVTGLKIHVPQPPEKADAAQVIRKLEIDRLHVLMENSSTHGEATLFHALQVDIDGASVDGHPFRVISNPDLFCEHGTKQKLDDAFRQGDHLHRNHGHHFFSIDEDYEPGKIPQTNGVIVGTVVKGIEWVNSKAEGCEIIGNQLKIFGIGSMYFGELIIEDDFRRLTLLRFQLGSPYGGEGSVCEAQSNGNWWPPKKAGT
jgi:hypothetical protein